MKDPAQLPWRELGVEIALECTGLFTSKEKAVAHLAAGAGRVIIRRRPMVSISLSFTASITTSFARTTELSPPPPVQPTASRPSPRCSTTRWGSRRLMTTVHAYTNNSLARPGAQGPVPGASGGHRHDPTSTGAAKAVALVLPELAGKLVVSRSACPRRMFRSSTSSSSPSAQRGRTRSMPRCAGRPGSNQRSSSVLPRPPNVSTDFNHNAHSSVFAMDQTKVMDGSSAASCPRTTRRMGLFLPNGGYRRRHEQARSRQRFKSSGLQTE